MDLNEAIELFNREHVKNTQLRAENKNWKELSGWQEKLLASYRMGTNPSEKCLNRIYELKKALKANG